MKILRIALKRETAMTMISLTLASSVCVALVMARVVWTMKLRYGFLVWNLFLAWVPLILAFLAAEHFREARHRRWRFAGLAGAWFLFFPNAPYIFTDLVHLHTSYFTHYWVDLALILSCALAGLVAGFVSLFLMHSVATEIFGRLLGWVFVGAVAAASSFGIFLGRFLRFNSWDVLFQPVRLYHGIGEVVGTPHAETSRAGFLIVFAAFLLISYVMLYGLTHLQPPPRALLAKGIAPANAV